MAKRKRIFIGVAAALAILLALTIVIVNLQRPQNGGSWLGASMLRAINTAEATYVTSYGKVGYAPNLAVLGPANSDNCDSFRACLLDPVLSCPEGVGQSWCVKGMYRFNIQSSSSEPPYRDYWTTATPIRPDPDFNNYCSASDAVLRWEHAAPLSRPYTLEECQALPELTN